MKQMGKIARVNRRGRTDEIVSNFGKSRKTQKRETINPQFKRHKSSEGKKDYPKYEKAVNKTQPVTSPRKVHKVEQGRNALSNRPNTNESGNPATPRDMELVKAKGRALMKMWGDNSIGRARSRIARAEQLLPHQSSAWSKHKNSPRGGATFHKLPKMPKDNY